MSAVWAVVLVLFFILVVLVVWGVLHRNVARGRNAGATGADFYAQQYASPNVWASPVPGPTGPRNVCSLYTFPSSKVGDRVNPGAPTLNPTVVNSLAPQPVSVSCLDPDRSVIQQVQHTCQGGTGQVSACYRYDGSLAKPGETELYYSPALCPTLPACPGELSLVELNFGQDSPPFCLATTGGLGTVVGVTSACDISSPNQLFRISRSQPGVTGPDTGQGILTRIVERNSGLCVVPSNLGATGVEPPVGTKAVLGPCFPNQGYMWGAIPSFPDVLANKIAPPQLAYVGYSDVRTIPTGLTGIAEWFQYKLSLSPSPDNKETVLALYNFDYASPAGKRQTAQYINYSLYNVLQGLPACIAGDTQACLPL